MVLPMGLRSAEKACQRVTYQCDSFQGSKRFHHNKLPGWQKKQAGAREVSNIMKFVTGARFEASLEKAVPPITRM